MGAPANRWREPVEAAHSRHLLLRQAARAARGAGSLAQGDKGTCWDALTTGSRQWLAAHN